MRHDPWWSRARPRLPAARRAADAPREAVIAASLFLATCLSVFLVYLFQWQPASVPPSSRIWRSVAFTGTLLAILLAHEAGHSVAARRSGLRLGLPWFVPFPFLVGTLGAIIRMDRRPATRASLAAMGAAGPLAGLLAVIVVMALRLVAGTPPPPVPRAPLASPSLWTGLAALVGTEPPPISAEDPLAFAAWIGCLVTAMNLFPIGQLDGGHVLRATAPGLARAATWASLGALAALGWWWPGWWAWLGAVVILGAHRSVDVPAAPPPSPVWALLCLAAFLSCVTARPSAWGW